MRAILPGIAFELGKSNEKALMLHIMHSENGLITCRAVERMGNTERELMENHALFLGYGTVLPVPKEYGVDATNYYSEQDALTLHFKNLWYKDKTYDIRIVPCISKWYEKSVFIFDHPFMAPTGQKAIEKGIDQLREKRGFYGKGNR